MLDRISIFEHQRGRPLLSALVVQASTGHAGDGFARLCRSLGYEIGASQELAFWRTQVEEVMRYWAGPAPDGTDPLGDALRQAGSSQGALAGSPGRDADAGGASWAEQHAGRNVFMEITRRDDIGTDLKAPSAPPAAA